MAGKTAIFVDVDSLNVIYKWNDKFVAALNYGSSVERLSETPPALGAGYDIYLCIKPRGEGEGNIVIDELSITGMPFTADAEELYQLLKFFRSYTGFGEVYLCNWVANYIASARVETFRSAVYYGNRVAFMSVSNSTLREFKLYDSQRDFVDENGEDIDAYGDLGLIDIDGVKARYPELASAPKAQLTALAPLVQCYRTPLKMETSEYFEWLERARASGEFERKLPEPEYTEPTRVEEPHVEVALPEPPIITEKSKKTIRGKAPILAKTLTALGCLVALGFGATAGVVVKEPPVEENTAYYNEVDTRIEKLRNLSGVYNSGGQVMPTVKEALEYFQQYNASISVAGFEFVDGNYTVRCLSHLDDMEDFAEYVGGKYLVVSVNDLGKTMVDGEEVNHFSVMFTVT